MYLTLYNIITTTSIINIETITLTIITIIYLGFR